MRYLFFRENIKLEIGQNSFQSCIYLNLFSIFISNLKNHFLKYLYLKAVDSEHGRICPCKSFNGDNRFTPLFSCIGKPKMQLLISETHPRNVFLREQRFFSLSMIAMALACQGKEAQI
jgi:hypothetical protein